MAIKEIPRLKFFQDKSQSGAIKKWVEGEVCAQLQPHVKGRTANGQGIPCMYSSYYPVTPDTDPRDGP